MNPIYGLIFKSGRVNAELNKNKNSLKITVIVLKVG